MQSFPNRLKFVLGVLCALPGACALPSTPREPEEPITWSAEWFQCDGRLQCIAVYDAYCQYTAVNANYSLVYQDWARQQVQRVGELKLCAPAESSLPAAAYCRNNRCEN